jgi:cytochrome c peroxidase
MFYRYFLLLATLLVSTPVMSSPDLGLPVIREADNRKITLGRKLFFDRRLSANGTLSCAMCHIPEQGFAQNQLATPVGFKGRTVKRNSPTLLNVAHRKVLFFDGREFTLEVQVWSPILDSREMGNVSIGAVIDRIRHLDDYGPAFRAVFPEGITVSTIGSALAAYERSLIAAGSPFDRWQYDGDESMVDEKIKLGFVLFNRHGCANCHTVGEKYAQFTDDEFHNTGIGFERSMKSTVRETSFIQLNQTISIKSDRPFETSLNDLGRYEMTGNSSDRWKYRTPTLRNIALTAPYMHDGSFSTLEEVIAFYMSGGIDNEGLDPLILPFTLEPEEVLQLMSFLNSLSSPYVSDLVNQARMTDIGDY